MTLVRLKKIWPKTNIHLMLIVKTINQRKLKYQGYEYYQIARKGRIS